MKIKLFLFMLSVVLFGVGQLDARPANPDSPFDVSWSGGPVEAMAGGKFSLDVAVSCPPGHYIYADETDIEFTALDGLRITGITLPKPVPYTDPFLGKGTKIYKGEVRAVIGGEVPGGSEGGEYELSAVVRFRGCSPDVCFRVEERDVAFVVSVSGGAPGSAGGKPSAPSRAGENTAPAMGIRELIRGQDFDLVLDKGLRLALLVVFLAGLLTVLTPCLWPVLPVVLVFVGVHPHKKFIENFLLAVMLSAGIAVAYSALGLGAVAFGKNLGFLFQHRWFLALVALFFLAMSLSMFGLFELRMPTRLHALAGKLGGRGYAGAFLAGVGLGLVASPCSGPVLAGLLGHVAVQRDFAMGFALLLVYSMGMGAVICILGAGFGELSSKFKGGAWMIWVRRVLGLLLIIPALFYAGSFFGWRPANLLRDSRPRVEWLKGEADALMFARREGRPLMVEFTADWCPPCHRLEMDFFRRSEIVRLSYQMVPLQIDATTETPEVREQIKRYKVVGWPSVIFLAPDGAVYEDLKVRSYAPALIEKGMREAIERAHHH